MEGSSAGRALERVPPWSETAARHRGACHDEREGQRVFPSHLPNWKIARSGMCGLCGLWIFSSELWRATSAAKCVTSVSLFLHLCLPLSSSLSLSFSTRHQRTLGERVGNGGGSPDPRALLSPGTKGMLGQLEGKIKELKRWLRDTELFIFNLCLRQDEELQQAHTQLQQFKVREGREKEDQNT